MAPKNIGDCFIKPEGQSHRHWPLSPQTAVCAALSGPFQGLGLRPGNPQRERQEWGLGSCGGTPSPPTHYGSSNTKVSLDSGKVKVRVLREPDGYWAAGYIPAKACSRPLFSPHSFTQKIFKEYLRFARRNLCAWESTSRQVARNINN